MKDSIINLLAPIQKRYGGVFRILLNNMRLALLLLFALQAAYLVHRVNALLNNDAATRADTPQKAPNPLSKNPDKDVLYILNELNKQDVTVDPNFENERVNPF